MKLSDLLAGVATTMGNDSLLGAIAFVKLARPIDELISNALAFGPYHPGRPSPWSHTFLLAEPYRGPATKILDCTIRDEYGKIEWQVDLKEVLGHGLDDSGGIYDGSVADYDALGVTAVGCKVVATLSDSQRQGILSAARSLQAQGYKYDIPGLFRELFRLLVHVPVPAGKKLLFCSAFVQASYREAGAGDFAPALVSQDVTPDDIWYSQLGLGKGPEEAHA